VLYTCKLNWFFPAPAVQALAWISTVLETALGAALLPGLFPRLAAPMCGVLLLLFALPMTLALGIKAPLDASVFTASAGAFLLPVVRDNRPAAPRGGNSTRHRLAPRTGLHSVDGRSTFGVDRCTTVTVTPSELNRIVGGYRKICRQMKRFGPVAIGLSSLDD
jgi:hypothetical protein